MNKRRTTILLRESTLKKVKHYAIENNKFMAEVIETALESFFRDGDKKTGGMPSPAETNRYAANALSVLDKHLASGVARKMLEEACQKHNIRVEELSRTTFTPELINELYNRLACIGIGDVSGLKRRLLAISEGGK